MGAHKPIDRPLLLFMNAIDFVVAWPDCCVVVGATFFDQGLMRAFEPGVLPRLLSSVKYEQQKGHAARIATCPL